MVTAAAGRRHGTAAAGRRHGTAPAGRRHGTAAAGRRQVPPPPGGVTVPPPPGGVTVPPPPGGVTVPPPPGAATAPPPPGEVVRHGPGVPPIPPAVERVWRPGRLPEPSRRPARLRRLAGSALTVILLAASGAVLYLRLHHAPIHVTGVVISQQTHTGCVVDVTGRITTNGSAGTVSYRWLFRPGQQAPQPLSQSVAAGQKAVYVTVAVEGQGHGTASQTVTLHVLGPDPRAASTPVVVSCG